MKSFSIKILSFLFALLLFSFPAKAVNVNISDLPSATSVTGTSNLFECEQGGINNQCTSVQIAAYIYGLMSGDATASGTGAVTFATVNANVGSFGSATQCVAVTLNAKGLTTAGSAVTCTPAVGSITGTGTGVITALGVNIGTAGSFVVNGGALGTPSSGVATNLTGTAAGLTAGTVTTNANLTGAVTSTGNAAILGSFTSANLAGALTDETGTGAAVFGTAPTISSLNATTAATLAYITGSTQCLHVNTSGAVTGTGSDCGSGSSTITAGTTPTSGITSGDFISSTTNLVADSGKAVPTGAVVGTSDSQTLTNKTLTSPTLTSPTVNTAMTLGFLTGAGTECMQVSNTGVVSGTGSACGGSGSTGANPTATGSDTATNGVASTFLRSDAAFAIQKTSSSLFGLAKVDNSTITASGGVISTVNNGTVTSVGAGCGTSTGGSAITTTGNVLAAFTLRSNTAATDTIVAADCGNLIYENRATSVAVAIAAAGTTGFAAGTFFMVCNINAGVATITPTTSTIGGASTLAIPAGSAANPVCYSFQSDGTNYNIAEGPTVNASLLSSGTVAAARGGAGTITGALKGNGSGTVSQAACADLSNGATGCSTATGTSGATLPLLNGTNSWSAVQTFAASDIVLTGGSGCATFAAGVLGSTGTACGGSITFPQTVAGTTNSGGIPYFSGTTTLSSSAALAANAIVIGGGAGVAPATTTTGTGVVTAIGNNLSAAGGLTTTIASGTSAMGTGAITSATCATVVTTTATNTATTDVVSWGFNGDPTAVTGYVPLVAGMLTIIAYPTANNVNFKVCNNTNGSVTPGAITLNWRVTR